MHGFEKLHPPIDHPIYDVYDFYQFKLSSQAFYRSQIRRIASVMYAVATGQMSMSHVQAMLQGKETWPENLPKADPNGLFLTKVEHCQDILKDATEDVALLPLGN